jgi:hypothetical protein
MTNEQENKLTMFNVTLKVLDKNSTQVGTVPALAHAKSNFASAVQTIRLVRQVQEPTTKGKTIDKQVFKENLANEAHVISSAIQAYAASIDDNDLYQTMNYSRTTLLGTEDEDLPQKCNNILDAANDLIANLGDFGITALQLSDFETDIEAWETETTQPRVAISERAAATQSLPVLFKKADAILKKQIDKLMERFLTIDPAFYATYKAARKIVNAGHGKLTSTVFGKTVNAVTGLGIGNVRVEDPDTGIFAITDANGVFELLKVPHGETELLCTREGFEVTTFSIDVKPNMDPIEILMQPEP